MAASRANENGRMVFVDKGRRYGSASATNTTTLVSKPRPRERPQRGSRPMDKDVRIGLLTEALRSVARQSKALALRIASPVKARSRRLLE